MIIDSPIVSGSQFLSGSSTQVGNAVISGSLTVTGAINATITGSITSASYANFAETSVSSSFALTASYAANVPLTASNANTASYAFFAVTASYAANVPLTASNANTASYAFFAVTSSNSTTSSYSFLAVTASNATTASYALNAELLDGLDSTSFATTTSFNSLSSSFATTSGSVSTRLNVIETTGYATTGSNIFTGPQYVNQASNAISFTSTASLYTDGGLRVAKDSFVSGTAYFNNITVYGTSSIQYITSSQVNIGANIITVNTDTPSIRFGGLSVFDSGSTQLTGSMLWDSEKNHWIYSNPSGSTYNSGMIMSGPRNSGSLGDEQGTTFNALMKGQGGDHITSSQIFDDGTTVTIPGNLQVTGSIVGTITTASFASTASSVNALNQNVQITGSLNTSANIQANKFVFTNGVINENNNGQRIFATDSNILYVYTGTGGLNINNQANTTTVASFSNAGTLTVGGPGNDQNLVFGGTNSSIYWGVGGPTRIYYNVGDIRFSTNAAVDNLILQNTGGAFFTYGLTGSLQGNASTSTTASFAQTASFVTTAQTASFVTTAQTASYVLNAVSSSFALTASYISGSGGGVGFPFSGSAVITGSLLITNLSGSGVRYVTTDANGLLVAQTASAAIISTQLTYATAGQTIYPISGGYTTGLVDVFVNGTKLNSTEYVDTSGVNIVLTTGSFVNDVVEFQKYFPASGVTNNALRQVNYFTATAGQTVFSASYTPGLLDVFYNGSKLDNTEYTANSGNAITLTTASAAGDKIEIDVYSYQVGSFSGIGGTASGSQIAYFNTSNSITGSPNFTVSGSSIVVTGSLVVSGSGTFVNIGPAIFSGSLTSTQGFTGSFSGTATSASFATTAITAFTASSIANLNQNVVVTGSLTTTGQIVAQTLNVQQVTSSIVYSSGSNIFGSALGNTQQMTGSVTVTGSFNVVTTGTELQVGATGVTLGNTLTDIHNVTGSLRVTGSFTQTGANTTSSFRGLVGIGTSSPISLLSLGSGFGSPAGSATNVKLAVYDNGTASDTYGFGISLSTFEIQSAENIAFYTGQSATRTERMRITTAGNVGIGTNSPSFLLDLQRSSAGADVALRVQNTAASGVNDASALHLGWSSNLAGYSSIITDRGGRAGSSSAQGSLYFNANQDATERIRMIIRGDNGNVGIGTTNPSVKLHIAASSSPYIRIDDTGVASEGGLIMQPTGYNAKGGLTLNFSNGEFKLFTGESGNGYFQTFYTNGTERMRITTAGSVCVNRTSGGGELNVQGTIYLYLTTAGAGNSTLKYNTSTGAVTYDSSARAYKKDIQSLNYGLSEVLQMSPKKYKYISNDTNDIGFIADEMYEIVPEIVALANNEITSGDFENGEPISINYDRLTPVLVKAIQELKAELDQAKAEIEILKNK